MHDPEDQHAVLRLAIEDDVRGMLMAADIPAGTQDKTAEAGIFGEKGECAIETLLVPCGLPRPEQFDAHKIDIRKIAGCTWGE